MDETRKHVGELFAGRFTVQERLAWNGLALTFRARDRDRTLALAVLPLNCETNIEHRRTFEETLDRVQEIVHPVFLRVEQVGIQQGVPFVGYVWTERPTLETLIESGTIDEDLAIGIARRLLVGLDAAHRSGLVHGDLTPFNVLVEAGQDDVRLVGLGFAPLIRYAAGDHTGPTGRGSGQNAVRYLAPEILAGARSSAQSDVYGVGALLFRMLTGGHPGKVQMREPSTPGLREVVDKAMLRDPEKRYQTARAMLTALDLGGEREREPSAAIPLWDDAPASVPPETNAQASMLRWLVPLMLVLVCAAGAAMALGGGDGEADGASTSAGEAREPDMEQAADGDLSETSEASALVDDAPLEEGPIEGENADDENADDENPDDENPDDENADDENPDDENPDDENPDDENAAPSERGGPMADLPPYLEDTLSQIVESDLNEDELRALYGWIANHEDDVRGHLTLCRVFMARRWFTAAFERYDFLLRADLEGGTEDPRTLHDLVQIAIEGNSMVGGVFAVLRREFERDAILAELDAQTNEARPIVQQRGAVLRRRVERL